jgi:hypothetical protein
VNPSDFGCWHSSLRAVSAGQWRRQVEPSGTDPLCFLARRILRVDAASTFGELTRSHVPERPRPADRGVRSQCAGDVQAEGGHGELNWDESGSDGAELPGGEPGPGVAGDAAGDQRGY